VSSLELIMTLLPISSTNMEVNTSGKSGTVK